MGMVWKLRFLGWIAGLTTDVREYASAHGDKRSPLKGAKLSSGERVRFACCPHRQNGAIETCSLRRFLFSRATVL